MHLHTAAAVEIIPTKDTPSMTDHPTMTTAPAPHYGPDDDRFPGTLFTSQDGTLRVTIDKGLYGPPHWQLQRRQGTASGSRWGNLFAARSRHAFLAGLAHMGLADSDTAAHVANAFPPSPR